MRVIFPYVLEGEKDVECLGLLQERIHGFIKRTNVPIALDAVTVDSYHDYSHLLEEMWDRDEDIIIIERDIVIHSKVLDTFLACPEDWCAFPYLQSGGEMGPGLGCTRFRRNRPRGIMPYARKWLADHTGQNPYHWTQQDRVLFSELTRHGCKVHVHEPPVTHLHYEKETK